MMDLAPSRDAIHLFSLICNKSEREKEPSLAYSILKPTALSLTRLGPL